MIEISQIATVRKQRGWSQQELAGRARVSVSLIQKAEQGVHTNLTVGNLKKIDMALSDDLAEDKDAEQVAAGRTTPSAGEAA